MKIKIRRATASSTTETPAIASGENVAGEPILGSSQVGSTRYDTLYVGARDGSSWKKVAMSSFTPAFENADSGGVNASLGMYSLWFGTQAEYDAISQKDQNTFYFITE